MLLPFLNWKLRQKILLFSILIASIPFFVTNIFWFVNAGKRVRVTAENNIILANQQASYQVRDYLDTKLLGFFSHSQGAALLSNNTGLIQMDLAHFLKQDPDVQSLDYVDSDGMELVKMDRNKIFPKEFLTNIKDTDPFKVATFYFGKEYISSVHLNLDKSPEIVIGVPITNPMDSESLRTFSSASKNPVPVGQIGGVLIGTVNLSPLLSSISSLHVGKSGYMYVIDENGIVIAHPNPKNLGRTSPPGEDTEIAEFLKHKSILTRSQVPPPTQKKSIDGVSVISTYTISDKTGWATIVEEPVSDITSDVAQIQHDAYPLFLLSLCLVFILSFIFARTLTQPILSLVKGTQSVGKGNFDYKFSIHTHDEIEQLSDSYHVMAQSLKFSLWSIEHERDALKVERNTMSTVLSSIGDGVVALDKSFRVVFSNTAITPITGLISKDIQGKEIDAVIHFKKQERNVSIRKLIETSADTGLTDKLQFLKDEELKTIHLVFSTLPDSTVSNIKYILTVYDLSKEEQLENMKLDFVSMAAHELRTPLTSIQGYLSVFIEENAEILKGERGMFLNRIQTSARQLMGLVENLLSVSRIEKGAFTINAVPLDWVSLVDETVTDFVYRAKEKKISLSFVKPKGKISRVKADKIRIKEVLSNILANAVAYTHRDGTVTVSLEEDKTDVITHIKDTGEGIPSSALPHLFTKFFRVAGVLSQGSKGTGLGLYISKAIIEMHQGKIWVDSEVKKGSTFSFSLPKAS